MAQEFLGIDISKRRVDVALLREGRLRHSVFDNAPKGFRALSCWLAKQGAVAPHICMEATGSYWEAIAAYLFQKGLVVSVVNPACVHDFRKSRLRRGKTDKMDAALLAEFCRAQSPRPWNPPPPESLELRHLVRRRDDLVAMRGQERNRLAAPGLSKDAQTSLKRTLAWLTAEQRRLERQIRESLRRSPALQKNYELLASIPGIGVVTATVFLGEVGRLEDYDSARQLAAHAGLTPQPHESGDSIRGKPRLCRIGNAVLRKGFYLAAVVAKKHNPVLREFCARLEAKGKPPMVIVAAAMRKLLHIAYGVLKHKEVFHANYQPARA